MNLWISTPLATATVEVSESGEIKDAPPIWKKFKGQKIEHLLAWLGTKTNSISIEPLEQS